MKLHQLTLHAFGPFAGTELIDFDRLGADGLFLLRGRTGAGKTSILDAVSFALYGDVPGQRDKTQLKSTHAPAESEPYVQLEFTQGGRRCRVWRSPHHGRPQKRDASRQREVGQRVVVEFLQDGTWEPYTSGIQAANDEMQRMLGLDLHQFTKVILLPQGAFAHFLHASSKDKQDLLERLFDTDRFTLLEKHLRELAREAEQQLKDSDTRIQTHRENLTQAALAMFPTASEAGPDDAQDTEAPSIEALSTEALSPEAPTDPDAPTTLSEAELAALTEAELIQRVTLAIDAQRARLRAGSAAAESAAQDAASAQDELRQREDALRRFAEHTERLAAHKEQEPQVSALRAQLHRHEAAQGIQTWFTTAADAAEEHHAAVAAAVAATKQAESTLDGFAARQPEEITARGLLAEPSGGRQPEAQQPDAQLSDAQRPPEPEPAALTAAIEELIALRARLSGSDAGQLETRLTELLQQTSRTEQQLAQTEAEAVRLSGQHEALDATHRDLQAQLEDPEQLEAARDAARTTAETLTGRVQTQRTRDELAVRCGNWRVRQAEREQAHAELKEQHQWRLQSYLRNIALQLAGELEDGMPCLVCGSTEHPHPAVDDDPSITQEEVEQTQLQLQDARDELSEAQIQLRSVTDQHDALLAELGEHAEVEITRTEADLAQAREALRLAEQHRSLQRELREQLDANAAERQRTQTRLVEAQHGAERDQAALLQQRTQAGELEAALSGLRGSYDSVARRREDLERVLDELRVAQARIEAAAVQRAHRDRAHGSAATRLEDSEFADQSDLEASLLTGETLQSSRSAVETWDELKRALDYESEQELIQAGRRRHREGQARPGAEELDRAAELTVAASQAARDATARLLRFDAQGEAIEGHSAKLVAALRHRDSALGEQRRRSELAATLNGAGPENALKMTLTTFVLAARLERVAEAATRHLATMSEGRYRLHHSDEAGGRGLRGLELKVHDDHSDVERPTSSLSGGETFMASLSMALGLAEVVQSESGGIGMESLFIDEGFGSLDEDTLEHVMSALHRLQGEGRRVGLVSHVTEMHRAIPTQLRIHRHRAGSTTEMVIP